MGSGKASTSGEKKRKMTGKPSKYTEDLLSECFACFDQGLLYGKSGNTEDACYMLQRGLDILKLAEKQKECKKSEQYKNVVETQKKVNKKLKKLKKTAQPKKKSDLPEEKGAEKQNIANELQERCHESEFSEAELIFYIPSGVQLFMIEGGSATVPTSCNELEIFRLNQQPGIPSNVHMDGFIRVGPWLYPLKAGAILVLKSEFGAYVMPNPVAGHPGMFVGLLLPADLEEDVENQFVELLKHYAEVREQPGTGKISKNERESMSDKISRILRKGGEKIAGGMTRAAEDTSAKIAERSSKYRSNIIPNEKPVGVHPTIQKGASCVHEGTKTIAKLMRYLLEKLGDVSVTAGQTIASGAEKTFGNGKPGKAVSGTLDVVGSGIVGVSTVWVGLEQALITLCKSVSNETVQTVKQKYGDEASDVTKKVLCSAGNTSMAVYYFRGFIPRAIADGASRQSNMPYTKDSKDRYSVDSFDSEVEKVPDQTKEDFDSKNSSEKCGPLL